MSYFLIGETLAGDGSLYVLWSGGGSAVRVLPWGSRDRRDMQALGRSLVELSPPFGSPGRRSGLIVAGALRHANGRRLALIELDDEEQQRIARSISETLPEDDGHTIESGLPLVLESEVLALMRQRLATLIA